jgi:hypothetical protein
MADTARTDKLRRLLNRLSDIEKERLWDSTGIDVDRWQTDEAKFADFEKHVADYRKMLSGSTQAHAGNVQTEQMPNFNCDSCGAKQMDAPYYVTIPRCTTLCAECTNVLLEQARNGHH